MANQVSAREIFAPIIGKPAWSVRKGHGSSLTLEFGEPHLRIREPTAPVHTITPKVEDMLRRRRIFIHGDWHLWICCCAWQVTRDAVELAHNQSADDAIETAAHELDGQILISIEVEPTNGTSAFSFDFGALLRTWPWPNDDTKQDQWMLYEPSGWVFAYRSDGYFSHHPGDEKPDRESWHRLAG